MQDLGVFSLSPPRTHWLSFEIACRLLPPFKYNCTLSVNLSLNSVQFQGPAVNVTAGRTTEQQECENKTTGRSELKEEREETGTGGEIEQQVIVKQTKRVANGLGLPPHLPRCETFGEYWRMLMSVCLQKVILLFFFIDPCKEKQFFFFFFLPQPRKSRQ